jgi:CheY-like chemotaxis protein
MSDLALAARTALAQTAFRVLVVDDDPDMAAFLARMLEREGMEAHIVADGAGALAAVAAGGCELVLLDVLLPDASGFDICERLKSDPASALIPVVLVTALEDRASRVRGIEAGADDFIHKPVSREELVARVKTLRRLHETRRELEARRLDAEIERKEAIHKAFSRYVSPRLTQRIIDSTSGGPFRAQAERADVVALFADLRGFTRITETIGVETVVDMLNEYFSVLTEAAYAEEGTIFNMAGDSLLVGFNVPFAQPDAPARAWRTALGMVSRFAPVARAPRRFHGRRHRHVPRRGNHRQRRLAPLHELHHHRRHGKQRRAPDADRPGRRGAAVGPALRGHPAFCAGAGRGMPRRGGAARQVRHARGLLHPALACAS